MVFVQGAQKIEDAIAIDSTSGTASPTRHKKWEDGPRGGTVLREWPPSARDRAPRVVRLINGGTLSGVPPYADEVS